MMERLNTDIRYEPVEVAPYDEIHKRYEQNRPTEDVD